MLITCKWQIKYFFVICSKVNSEISNDTKFVASYFRLQNAN